MRTFAQMLAEQERRRERLKAYEAARKLRADQARAKRKALRAIAAPPKRRREDDAEIRERELTRGLAGEVTRIFNGCSHCHDMPWRRHWAGCRGCGLPYAAEVIAFPCPTVPSSAGMAASIGDSTEE